MRIVVKFGGTSLASIERIRRAAEIVKRLVNEGHEIIVAASAMAGTTNNLVEYTSYFYSVDNNQEYDSILASGEQVSSGLLAMALIETGLSAKSLLAWQIPITTDDNYANAQIKNIVTDKIENLISKKIIPVVAGFQGLSKDYNLTTLGRGGGDTSAVAVAASLKACCCYIYTDVDGIYVSDPRVISNPKKWNQIAYDSIIEMANSGAKVLHCRSIELAYKYNIDLYVKSTFKEDLGTHIVKKEEIVENPLINGIVSSTNEVMFSIKSLKSQNEALNLIDSILESGISIDMLQKQTNNSQIELNFVVSRDNFDNVNKIIKHNQNNLAVEDITFNTEVVKISIIGVGVQTHPIIMQKMFKIIAKNDINIILLATANLKISILVDSLNANKLVELLYNEYKEYFNEN
ncbi:aspartate kinase [Rickettsiales bacterium LUAb2]